MTGPTKPPTYSPSFAFLAQHDPLLAWLPTAAEHYFHTDPVTCLMKVRQFAEMLAKHIAATANVALDTREQADRLRRLEQCGEIDRFVKDSFHRLRSSGNEATHSARGSLSEARRCLAEAHRIAVWFHRRFANPQFKVPSYALPSAPPDPGSELKRQIDAVQAELRDAKRKVADVEERSTHAIVERDVAMELAQELESLLAVERDRFVAKLKDLHEHVVSMSAHEQAERALRRELAGRDLPEVVDYDRPGVWVEQRYHIDQFIGREREFAQVEERLRTMESGYLLLVGAPGLGKSAMLAKLAEWVPAAIGARGAAAAEYPVLLHMGKSTGDQRQILQFLLWQASRYLEEPLPAGHYTGGILDLRERLVGALARISDRHGGALVVVDALDEIVRDPEQPAPDLIFLPDILPRGVRVVISSRPLEGINSHLARRLSVLQTMPVLPMGADDVQLLLEARLDAESLAWIVESGLLGKIADRTGGVPLLLRRVIAVAPETRDASRHRPGDASSDWIPTSLEAVFADHYREAVSPPRARGSSGRWLREQVLALLALTTEPLHVTELARAITLLGQRVDRRAVHKAVMQLGSLLVDIGGHSFRLYHQGFAEYVRAQIGASGEAAVHRALAGGPLEGPDTIEARFWPRVQHLLAWHAAAVSDRDAAGRGEAAAAMADELGNYATIRDAIAAGYLHSLIEAVNEAMRRSARDLVAEHQERLGAWASFLNRETGALSTRPHLFRQQARLAREPQVAEAAEADPTPSGAWLRPVWTNAQPSWGQTLRTYPDAAGLEAGEMHSLQVASGAPLFALGSHGGALIGVWNVDTGEQKWRRGYGSLRCMHTCLAIAPSGNYVAAATYTYVYADDDPDGDPIGIESGILLLDGGNGDVAWELQPQIPGEVHVLAFSPDGRSLWVGTGAERDYFEVAVAGAIYRIDVATREVVATTPSDEMRGPVRTFWVSEHGDTLYAAGGWWTEPVPEAAGAQVEEWDGHSLTLRRRTWVKGEAPALSLAGCGGYFLVGCGLGELIRLRPSGSLAGRGMSHLTRISAILPVPGTSEAILFEAFPQRLRSLASMNARVSHWDVERDAPIPGLPQPTERVRALSPLFPNRQWLVATGSEVSLRQMPDLPTVVDVARGPEDVYMRIYSPDLRFGIDATNDHFLLVRQPQTLQGVGEPISVVAKSPGFTSFITDRRWSMPFWYAALANDGTVVILDDALRDILSLVILRRPNWRGPVRLPIVGAAVTALQVSEDGSLVAVGLRPRHPVESMRATERKFLESRAARLEPQLRSLAESGATGEPVISGEAGDEHPLRAAVSKLSMEHLRGIDSPRLLIVETATLAVRLCLSTESLADTRLRFSPDGRYVACWRENEVWVLRVADGEEVVRLVPPRETIGRLAVSMVTGADSVPAPNDEAEIRAEFVAAHHAFSRDGHRFHVAGSVRHWYSTLRTWDLESGQELDAKPLAPAGPFALTLDGRHLVYHTSDGLVVCSMSSDREVAFWPRGGIEAVAVRDEGRIALRVNRREIEVLELLER